MQTVEIARRFAMTNLLKLLKPHTQRHSIHENTTISQHNTLEFMMSCGQIWISGRMFQKGCLLIQQNPLTSPRSLLKRLLRCLLKQLVYRKSQLRIVSSVASPAISPYVSPPRPGIDRRRHTHEQDLSNSEKVPFPNLWPASVEGARSSCWGSRSTMLAKQQVGCFYSHFSKLRFGPIHGRTTTWHCRNNWFWLN